MLRILSRLKIDYITMKFSIIICLVLRYLVRVKNKHKIYKYSKNIKKLVDL